MGKRAGYVQAILATIQFTMVHVHISKLKLFPSYCVGVKFGLMLREEHRLGVVESRVVGRMFDVRGS